MEDIADLFNRLESNQPQIVEDGKKTFHEFFNATKEPWLVNGVFEYYINTSSVRSIEILVGVREPHDKHLFDKLLDAMKGSSKLQALTLLGHVVRRQPTWLYKITHHPLMKELIKLLKIETDILPLMSALLVLIVLLPMIPALIGSLLPDIFEVFSRLAAWNTTNPNKLPEEQLLHLQVGLYALFHRLYGMYPCNFLSYLRHEYGQREHLGTFSHTIKPMLDTVKMHPLLVTASKDAETAPSRWKKMEHHDVIVECAKFALDTCDRSRDETGYQSITSSFRSRCSTYSLEPSEQSQVRTSPAVGNLNLTTTGEKDAWSPSLHCGFVTPPPEETPANSIPHTPNSQSYIISTSLPHQEGTSPPEAAIEATPETTPIKDVRPRPTPINSNVVRALNSFSSTKWPAATSNSSTPTQSQPSSPMKKEPPTQFPEVNAKSSAFELPRRDSLFQPSERRDSLIAQKMFQKVNQERSQASNESPAFEKLSMNLWPKTFGVPPTSPLRTIACNSSPVPNSPVPVDLGAALSGKDWHLERPRPEKNGFRFQESASGVTHDSTQEDQEVLEIVRRGERLRIDSQPRPVSNNNSRLQRQCDSVLQEIHPPHVDEYEECEQESGSPCTSGGLHMPNSRSMLDFRRRVTAQHRQRFYSQCVSESTQNHSFSTGSSPGEGAAFPQQFQVRRANSCPEMKKVPALPTAEVLVGKTLHEKEELEIEVSDDNQKGISNGRPLTVMGNSIAPTKLNLMKNFNEITKHQVSASTQTVDHWMPLPYEHLFLGVLPPEYNGSTAPSPAPQQLETPFPRFSPYAMLDKYIDTVVHLKDETKKTKVQSMELEVKTLREQLVLLNIQLQFERHRREVHAERNRRLLGKSRSNRSMEEHNSALRDQVTLLQKDIEKLHNELDAKKEEFHLKQKHDNDSIFYLQNQCSLLQTEVKDLKAKQLMLHEEIKETKVKAAKVNKEYQQVEKKLFDVGNEMRYALAQASVGEQLRTDVAHLQKELLLLGELQQAYRERASQLAIYQHRDQDQMTLLRDTSTDELKTMHELMDTKSSSLEAAKCRVGELELVVTRRDMLIAEQKRYLKQVKEEYQEQLEGVESKYRSQCALNQRLEEHVLSLYHQMEQENKRIRGTRSPDSSIGSGSVAHEVSVSSAGSAAERPPGFSPHNSPLSESLGISEKLPLFAGENIGMKNLQVIVDQPEQTPAASSSSHPLSGHQLLESPHGEGEG